MIEASTEFLTKAEESLAGAESEFANGRYNNCANRCYYSSFQAAIAALALAGVQPTGGVGGEWGHTFVQSHFANDLITRRKLYPSDLREVLSRAIVLRQAADYKTAPVSQTQASRALRRAAEFFQAIQGGAAR